MARPHLSPGWFTVAVAAALLSATPACTERGSGKNAARKVAERGAAATGATACGGEQTCTSTDAHAKHQAAGFDCISCHPCGAQFGFQVGFTFAGGTAIAPTDSYTPASGSTAASCTVACHYPMGSPAHAVSWGAAAPLACVGCHDVATLLARVPAHPPVSATASRAECEVCHVVGDQHTSGTVTLVGHPDSWMARADAGFHAFSANRGIAACQACHAQDLSGGRTGSKCADCHVAGGTANDFATCTACHGGGDNPTGAPPPALWGYAGDPSRGGGAPDAVRVGAHSAHVVEGTFGRAFGCEVCHVKPTSITSLDHIDTVAAGADPLASVIFSGLAVNGVPAPPQWTRASATCSGTYCHGATMDGTAGVRNPVWTSGSSQVYCGSCHGAPPPPPHIAVDTSGGYGACSPCHTFTVSAGGAIVPASEGGKHLNGLLEATGHDAAWMDPMSSTFHAFAANRGIANCTACHGADLGGGSASTACADCHRAGGMAPDFATCTACHGGEDNPTGAPPPAIWGYAGDPLRGGGTADPIRVGAHTRHLAPGIASPVACGSCHVVPANVLTPSHIDDPTPVATVTFGGLAAQVPPGPAPSWSRATAGCAATYCHGNYAGVYAYEVYDWGSDSYTTVYVNYAGKRATAAWTDGPMTCGSCHDNPPRTGTWHSGYHGYDVSYRQCQVCHPDATSTGAIGEAITNPAQHVNGIVEVTPRWSTRCFNCH